MDEKERGEVGITTGMKKCLKYASNSSQISPKRKLLPLNESEDNFKESTGHDGVKKERKKRRKGGDMGKREGDKTLQSMDNSMIPKITSFFSKKRNQVI